MKQLFEQLEKQVATVHDYASAMENSWLQYKMAIVEALVKEIKSKLETK